MFSGRDLLTFRFRLVLLCALPCAVVLPATPALADLRVCNETRNAISVALGYRAERGWQSEGWWLAPPTQCATVFEGDLNTVNSSFFYIFAADDIGGGAWDGSAFMCTRDETFTIFGVEDCLARGYERTGFLEVDTNHRSDWMLQLTDGGPPAGGTEADGPPDQIVELGGADDAAPLENTDDAPPLDDTGADQEGVDSE